jgi:sulfatase modifying factor 1
MKIQSLLTLAVTSALITSASASITMDWVNVGNLGNAADTNGYGAVAYAYQIGKYEVTNAQYAEFLNAKGQSNDNGIYNNSMPTYGITQLGSSGSYTYTVTTALANRPVVYVSWFDAARFANWMMNGQGSASMETGAYTLNGATSGIITANIGAQVYIPSENEWYKAAYYNAANTSYSLYPNGQNTITTADANYGNTVGSATNVGTYIGDPSSYGTNDQGGNVWEWNDAVISSSARGLRGGAWSNIGGALNSSLRNSNLPSTESNLLGFRVASVPEPTSIVLSMLAGGMMLIRRKR